MALQSTVAHNSTHAAGGADAITPADIGAVAASEKGAVNGIATLDASAKLAASQLPDLAISDFLGAVANEAGMLAKTGQKGDWVTRSDDGKVYVITGDAPAQASSWTALSYPVASTQQNADWSAASGVAQILNKPSLGTAAATDASAYATAAHGHGNLTNDGKVRVPYGGILSVSGVDAGSFSDGTFPIIQGDGVGGVITVLNGVISVTSAGSGYVDGLATKAGGSRYNLITQSTQNASANLPVITTTDGAVSVMSPDNFRATIGAASSSHEHSAADITSGTLDIARIPVLPSQKQIVSSGSLGQLTTQQQGEIGQGTIVTTTDGRRWVYTGSGSKVTEGSYIILADVTPEWSAIASKPSFVELASTSGVPDSQATPITVYIDDFGDGIQLSLNSGQVNGKNSYGPTTTGNYPNYTVTIQWNGTAWVMSYTSPFSNGARQFTASGDTLYPWHATWGTDSTGNFGGVEVNRVGTYTAALSAKPLAAEASSGIGAKAAREDHAHPLPTPAQIGAAPVQSPTFQGRATFAPDVYIEKIEGEDPAFQAGDVRYDSRKISGYGNSISLEEATFWDGDWRFYNPLTVAAPTSDNHAVRKVDLDGKLGLSASSYIIVKPSDDLAAKYTAAKALTPNGAALSATNRASLIIFPGRYTLSAELAIDAEFVDVIGLGAQRQNPVVFVGGSGINPANGFTILHSLFVSANNVRVSGISVSHDNSNRPFKIGANKPLQIFENCVGGVGSFSTSEVGGSISGTFIRCAGGNSSFGGQAYNLASGTFIDCFGGPNSCFGGGAEGVARGVFTDCKGGWYSYGGSLGDAAAATGTFTRCTGDRYSFAGFGSSKPSGVFINCILSTTSTPRTFKPLVAPASGKARMIGCIDADGNIIEGEAPV
jgi:hypothetical protein